MIQVTTDHNQRISQGDIYRNIEYVEYVVEKDGIVEISKIEYPLVIVLTQDCDLEQDFKQRLTSNKIPNHDKWLVSVLVAPLYNVEHFYLGEHLTELGYEMQKINKSKTPGMYLRDNQIPRFHYLEFPDTAHIVPSVIDFKHYFSVDVHYLHGAINSLYVCSVKELYREDISHRFASFLARIGLP